MDPEAALKMVIDQQRKDRAFFAFLSGDSYKVTFTCPHLTGRVAYTITRSTGVITNSIGGKVFDSSNDEMINKKYIKQDDGSFVCRNDYDGPDFSKISKKFCR